MRVNRRSVFTIFTIYIAAATTGLVLSGCGSDDELSASREGITTVVAQAEEEPEPTAPVTPTDTPPPTDEPSTPNDDVEGVAGIKGSRLCVKNRITSSTNNTFSVKFTKADTSDSGELAPGETRCGEGKATSGQDVMGEIYLPNDEIKVMPFQTANRQDWLGAPTAFLKIRGPSQQPYAGCNSGYASGEVVLEGDYSDCDNDQRWGYLWRLKDTDSREWLIEIEQSGAR